MRDATRRMVEAADPGTARFPAVKQLGHLRLQQPFPSVNKALVMELARCEYIQFVSGERNRRLKQRHRQDRTRPWGWAWPICTALGIVREASPRSRRPGPRVDGGQETRVRRG